MAFNANISNISAILWREQISFVFVRCNLNGLHKEKLLSEITIYTWEKVEWSNIDYLKILSIQFHRIQMIPYQKLIKIFLFMLEIATEIDYRNMIEIIM